MSESFWPPIPNMHVPLVRVRGLHLGPHVKFQATSLLGCRLAFATTIFLEALKTTSLPHNGVLIKRRAVSGYADSIVRHFT